MTGGQQHFVIDGGVNSTAIVDATSMMNNKWPFFLSFALNSAALYLCF